VYKAVKNDVEIAGLRKAGRRDCAALCGFYGWLETRLGRVGDGVELKFQGRVDGVCRLGRAGAALGADGRRARSRQ